MKKLKADFFNMGLPKWPGLIVVGESITPEQAKEVLIRTDTLSFCSNDFNFEKMLNQEVFGVFADWSGLDEAIAKANNLDPKKWMDINNFKDKVLKQYNLLNLHYLSNKRIVSAYIGGAHGWCDWDGTIGTNDYNIGKWPSVEEVYKEWVKIAKAFPFLDLKAQLLDGETCETERPMNVIVQFNVKNGKVKMVENNTILVNPVFNGIDMVKHMFDPYRERGCTIEVFREALQIVKNSNKVNA